jgi:hypothetical protein
MFEFGFEALIFYEVMTRGLRISVFRTFFPLLTDIHLNIWYIALPYKVANQVRLWF